MVRNLFEEIFFDLDTHRITGFKMKDWAESFLTVRGALHDAGIRIENAPDLKDQKRELPHRSDKGKPIYTIDDAKAFIRELLHFNRDLNMEVLSDRTEKQIERNDKIRQLHKHGYTFNELGNIFGISPQRVHQIVNFRRK